MPKITVRGPQGPPVSHRIDQDAITVGRSASNDLYLRDPQLSRNHLEIRWEGSGWVVADRDSLNGSRLNGRPLKRPEPLLPGDEVRLGDTVLVFEADVPGAVDEAASAGDDETAPAGWSSRGSGRVADAFDIVGHSPAVRAVLEMADRVARSTSSVLVLGENGTGKELLARRLHRLSPRSRGPFVVVNCPALAASLVEAELFGVEKGIATGVEPRAGKLEIADRGTLLLDEVGDLDLAAQAKLLRFLQDRKVERIGGREPKPVDVRLIAATNQDLEAAIAAGRFRRDLYHRLNVVAITLPPLRERREDIPELVAHFLAQAELRSGLRASPAVLEHFASYPFPGNVRELEHALESAALLARGSEIQLEDLPESLRRAPSRAAPAATSAAAAAAAPVAIGGGNSDAVVAPPAGVPVAAADRLYARIVLEKQSFWQVVREPFLRRELARDDVRALIARGHREAGGSYRKLSRLFGLEREYKKLVNFLQNHDLGVREP